MALPPNEQPAISVTFGQLWAMFMLWVCIAIGYNVARDAFGWGLDATDLDGWHRSGVRLITDYGTGCQYLETAAGGIVPRKGVACTGAAP